MIEDVIRLAFKTVLRTFLPVENRPLEVLIVWERTCLLMLLIN